MVCSLLVGIALLCAGPSESQDAAVSPDIAQYEVARAGVGRDPDGHVRLALWCEAHGLKAERAKHLALAVLHDPTNTMARGLLGLVAYGGRWQRPEAVGSKVQADADLTTTLAEYNTRREKAGDKADDQWRLALWCEENGLKAEASAHFAAVVRLDPSRGAAWIRLGCKKVNGRWLTEEQIVAEKRDNEARKKADKLWKPQLVRWRGWLRDKNKREDAEQLFATVTDPYAVAAIWSVFVDGAGTGVAAEQNQTLAVQLLGQIDSPRASQGLAMLAVFSDGAEVRRRATETLKSRDSRDYLGSVITLLRKRVKYQLQPVGGPGSTGGLFIEGERVNVQRLYSPPPMPNIPIFDGEPVSYDAAGLPVVRRFLGSSVETSQQRQITSLRTTAAPAAAVAYLERHGLNPRRFAVGGTAGTITTTTTTTPVDRFLEIPIGQLMLQYQTAARVAQQQQLDDVQIIEEYNDVVGSLNDRATQVLRNVTGEDRGEDPKAWAGWWVDQLGYAARTAPEQPVPTMVQDVPLAFTPPGIGGNAVNQAGPSSTNVATANFSNPGGIRMPGVRHNCFKGGTPVRTLTGPRAIESIRVGDQVLSQDVQTGALSYQPVLFVFHNPPAETLRVELESGSIVSTTIHRFWKAGQGWVMARDLKPGDPIRTLDGTTRVRTVENDEVQPVFNLQVARGASFFVGEPGTLVHDNSLVRPVAVPFDAPPQLAAATN